MKILKRRDFLKLTGLAAALPGALLTGEKRKSHIFYKAPAVDSDLEIELSFPSGISSIPEEKDYKITAIREDPYIYATDEDKDIKSIDQNVIQITCTWFGPIAPGDRFLFQPFDPRLAGQYIVMRIEPAETKKIFKLNKPDTAIAEINL